MAFPPSAWSSPGIPYRRPPQPTAPPRLPRPAPGGFPSPTLAPPTRCCPPLHRWRPSLDLQLILSKLLQEPPLNPAPEVALLSCSPIRQPPSWPSPLAAFSSPAVLPLWLHYLPLHSTAVLAIHGISNSASSTHGSSHAN
ncbi:hypothetical protein GOP47_0008151 [Adiantum capillus-veneris]|uniref:Uncharacterized protein n=1 Tax=Adiantum capillus-veneris TaxID=13818 RepID=A0A9D4UY95_ADICA|nr:hypothetical protein GOP47_0008151 [Adiantum capillus-veneris]